MDLTLSATNCTFVATANDCELHVEQTRNQLKTLTVLPSAEEEGVKEIAWLDLVKPSPSSSLADSRAWEAANPSIPEKDKRGRSYIEGKIKTNGDRAIDKSFIIAGGAQLVWAKFAGAPSEKRQLADQADSFYYSGHGHYGDGKLEIGHYDDQSNFVMPPHIPAPSEMVGASDMKWDKDMETIIIGGCSVLGIKTGSLRYPSMTKGDRELWDSSFPNGTDPSPGTGWESLKPGIKLGYCWSGPSDVPVLKNVIINYQGFVNAGSDPFFSWGRANGSNNAWNACAIDTTKTPYEYWYFKRPFGGYGYPEWVKVIKNQTTW